MRLEYILGQPNFTVANIGIVNVSRGKNYCHSYRNGRIKHGFIYTVRGRMRDVFLDGPVKTLEAGEGELVFIPKGCAYEGIYLEDNTEIKIVQFDLASGTLPDYLSAPRKIPLPQAEAWIDAFFHPRKDHTFYHFACLYNLLWQTDECCAGIPGRFRRLEPALRSLASHCERSEKVEYYAGLCGMSEVHFRRLFREYTGVSPIEYRNDIRLKKARTLLQSREYNVSEAAEQVGFSNLSFFIRLYRQKYGHTPKKA